MASSLQHIHFTLVGIDIYYIHDQEVLLTKIESLYVLGIMQEMTIDYVWLGFLYPSWAVLESFTHWFEQVVIYKDVQPTKVWRCHYCHDNWTEEHSKSSRRKRAEHNDLSCTDHAPVMVMLGESKWWEDFFTPTSAVPFSCSQRTGSSYHDNESRGKVKWGNWDLKHMHSMLQCLIWSIIRKVYKFDA